MPLPVTLPSIPRLLPSSCAGAEAGSAACTDRVTAAASRTRCGASGFVSEIRPVGERRGRCTGGRRISESGRKCVYAWVGSHGTDIQCWSHKAHITAADARLDHVAANYEKTFLLALEDTENAYVAHTAALERRDQLVRAETAAERSTPTPTPSISAELWTSLSVLDAQRTRLSTSDERTKAETAVRVALVSLYRAFGGGWSGEPSVGRPPS